MNTGRLVSNLHVYLYTYAFKPINLQVAQVTLIYIIILKINLIKGW